MRHRRFQGRHGWPAPLDPVQRRRMIRAAVPALVAAMLTGLAWGKT